MAAIVQVNLRSHDILGFANLLNNMATYSPLLAKSIVATHFPIQKKHPVLGCFCLSKPL
jgi:hypothetical protein